MSARHTWASRGLNSVHPHEQRHAARAELRARIIRVLAAAGDDGMPSCDLGDELATRAKPPETSAEVKRMKTAGLAVYELRGEGRGLRWYLTDAGREAAGKAAA